MEARFLYPTQTLRVIKTISNTIYEFLGRKVYLEWLRPAGILVEKKLSRQFIQNVCNAVAPLLNVWCAAKGKKSQP